MTTLEKQTSTMRDVAAQLIIIKLDVGKDHYDESLRFKQVFKALFDISNKQDVESNQEDQIRKQ